MSTFTQRGMGSLHRLARHFGGGGTVAIRRPHSLQNVAAGGPPSLLVRGTTSAGASSIDLDDTSLEGTAPAGMTFTIAGDATVYSVSTALAAASNILTGLAFTPVLDAEATDNAAVTIVQAYGETTYRRVRRSVRFEDEDDRVDRNQHIVDLAAVGQATAPEVGDILIDGAASEYIQSVTTLAPNGVAMGWSCVVGDERAVA